MFSLLRFLQKSSNYYQSCQRLKYTSLFWSHRCVLFYIINKPLFLNIPLIYSYDTRLFDSIDYYKVKIHFYIERILSLFHNNDRNQHNYFDLRIKCIYFYHSSNIHYRNTSKLLLNNDYSSLLLL